MYDDELMAIRERLEIGTFNANSPYLYVISRLVSAYGGICYRLEIWHKEVQRNPVMLDYLGVEQIRSIAQESYLTLRGAQRAKEALRTLIIQSNN
jgi:hypothetical protein